MGNDVTILTGIVGILIVMGIMMPWVYEMVNFSGSSADVQPPLNPLGNQTATNEYASISAANWYAGGLGIITSLAQAFFFYYPWFPVWLTTLHILIRVIGGVLIYRLIRSGAG